MLYKNKTTGSHKILPTDGLLHLLSPDPGCHLLLIHLLIRFPLFYKKNFAGIMNLIQSFRFIISTVTDTYIFFIESVYPCFCSRAQLHAASAPHTSDGNVIYPGTCRGLTAEEIAEKRKKKAPAYRLMVPDENITFTDGCMGEHTENLLRDCGDFYLRRADGVFAYQLAVVVDDARMGVTEVVRGADLLSSTARQLYLYRLLGLPAPKFAHCPLLLASDGRRLSKRDGDQSLENLRARYTAEDIVGRLAYAYGLQEEPAPRTPESLIKDFSWDKVPKKDICLPEGLFE